MEVKEPLLLAIETGSTSGGIALLRGNVLEESTGEAARAEKILTQIDVMLERAGVSLRDLDRIGVSVGPGSFTGIRIGIATALGLRRGLSVEVAGIDALQALASVSELNPVTSVMKVGRSGMAMQDFCRHGGIPVKVSEAIVLDEVEMFERMSSSPNTHFVVSAWEESFLTDQLLATNIDNVSIERSNVAVIIARFAATGASVALEPIYLRHEG